MAREVEHLLEDILGKAKGGGHDEGVKELKLLKDRYEPILNSPQGLCVLFTG